MTKNMLLLLQVYVSDLTELFTWTCARCDGVTEVREFIKIVCLYICKVGKCKISISLFLGSKRAPQHVLFQICLSNCHFVENRDFK